MEDIKLEVDKEPSVESNISDEECIARNKRKRKVASDTMRKISSHTRGGLPEKKILRKGSLEVDEGREGSCDRFGCQLSNKCCLELTENCQNFIINNNIKDEGTIKNGGIHKSYHISKGEHSCTTCYDEIYRFGKKGELKYKEWKKQYIKESRCFPHVRMYIQDELLPYWIKCKQCNKFRKINQKIDSQFIFNFKCDNCEINEDDITNVARDREFINSLSTVPLLHNSPAVFYLEAEYFYDEIGMSPVNTTNNFKSLSENFMKPFNVPDSPTIAFCIKPDIMENDEIEEFPEYTKESLYYLAMRNLIVSLWSLNPYTYLTLEQCESYLIVRGLSRIWYLFELERVYNYLNLKCIINYGILPIVEKNFLKIPKSKIIIVGSGISGLTVGRQLRSFGIDVTILEAKEIIGGRMQDDRSLGVAVGKGAQLITGILNNPLVVTLNQLGIVYKPLDDYCPLVDSVNGGVVDILADRISDEHYSCLLDAISDWKKNTKDDVSLDEIMSSVHLMLKKKCKMHWRKDFERLVQWHIGNAEFSCGSRIENVSAKHWDQNEAAPQFAGDHALLTDGCGKLMESLAEGIDIRLNEIVEEIDFTGSIVNIKCKSGSLYEGNKVVLALPLAIYQKEVIKFVPKLPDKKINAYKNLGAGLIEKVAVKFPTRFWSGLLNKDGKLDYFGCVPSSEKDRGLFNMFYDFSKISEDKPEDNCYVLMSYVCGKSVKIVNELSDEEVGKLFVETLQRMFPDIEIPQPLGQIVTHWGRDNYIGMSYSYIKINGTGEDYDNLAANIDRKIYFAGECTNRWFPQTMTGAFITGLREAGNILEDLFKKFLTMKKLNCPVQNYAWGRLGDKSIVSTLKSTTTSNLDLSLPYAELWMGTHKNGPAKLLDDDTYLSDYLKKNPNLLESHENGDIQFLLKVLSVNKALSIQCHPTKEQAEILRMKDPKNYPDNNHKPEMAIALSNFELLCGFRVTKEILENLSIVPELKDKLNKKDIEDLESDNAQINKKALKNLFIMVMEGDNLFNQTIINNSIERIRKKTHPTDVEKLFVRLDKEYPGGDVGVLVSLFLNYYTLSPGQSVFLGPNIPHAYLSGECVECMACSDNTIRAGLTPKFKDVKTLGENLIYEMSPPKYFIRDEKKKDEGIIRYAPDVEEFSIDFLTNKVKILENVKASSILIVIKGSAEIGGKNNLKIRSGDIIFVPASQENTPFSNVSSDFEAYRAYTPKR